MTEPSPDDAPPPRPPVTFAVLVALGFGAGLLRPAPGTWGSLAALLIGWGLLALDPLALYIAAGVATAAGIWAAGEYQRLSGRHDASEVVVDEVAGQWIALCALPLIGLGPTPAGLAAAFLLFRLFDIWKPGPIGWADRRLAGGLGVMADDVLAGAAAGLGIWALVEIGGIV